MCSLFEERPRTPPPSTIGTGTFMSRGRLPSSHGLSGVKRIDGPMGRIRRPLAIATAFEVALIFAGILCLHLALAIYQPSRLDGALGLDSCESCAASRHPARARPGSGPASEPARSGCCRWPSSCTCRCFSMDLHTTAWRFFTRPGNPLFSLLGYGSWCAFQQYLTQSYFNNRLMLVIRNRHVSSALVGIMFSATHIPNLILMIATLVAGFVFAEVFARYRNIWPLASGAGGRRTPARRRLAGRADPSHARGTGVFLSTGFGRGGGGRR